MDAVTGLASQLVNGVVAVGVAALTHAVPLTLAAATAALARQDLAAHRRETTKFRGDRV